MRSLFVVQIMCFFRNGNSSEYDDCHLSCPSPPPIQSPSSENLVLNTSLSTSSTKNIAVPIPWKSRISSSISSVSNARATIPAMIPNFKRFQTSVLRSAARAPKMDECTKQLMRTIVRNTILSCIILITSLLTSFIFVVQPLLSLKQNERMQVTFMTFDSLVNIFCIRLTFSFSRNEYQMLCRWCNTKCVEYFIEVTEHRTVRHAHNKITSEISIVSAIQRSSISVGNIIMNTRNDRKIRIYATSATASATASAAVSPNNQESDVEGCRQKMEILHLDIKE